MLMPLIIGSLMTILNLAIQVVALSMLVRYFIRRYARGKPVAGGALGDFTALYIVMLVLFAGHIVQFATWAVLFMWLNEFQDFATAFYHSTVNFASLGYGDIVMSEKWRLLGALEACNGVLMFGLTAGTVLSVMNTLFKRYADVPGIGGQKVRPF